MRVLAHRGSHATAPENSLAAFAAAVELGADGIECDVRRTLDGVLVVHHDAAIGARRIAATPYDELEAIAGSPVVTLDEVLRAVAIVVNVEIKPERAESPAGSRDLVASVARCVGEAARGSVVVSSFDAAICRTWREMVPEVPVGWLLGRQSIAAAIRRAQEWSLPSLHPPIRRLRERDVVAAHEGGLALRAWTVNRHRDLARCAEWGVDAVITDDVARARAVATAARKCTGR